MHISCDDVLCRCFLRTALGFKWELHGRGGRDPYLCDEDAHQLITAISDASTALDCCPTYFVINYAHQLKIERLEKAFTFLQLLHCDHLAHALDLDVEPPTRGWLAGFVQANGLVIRAPQPVDQVRRKACDRRRVGDWFERFGSLLQTYDPEMILNMDETGLATNQKFKVVVPNGVFPVVPGGKQKEVHITGVVTISASGHVFTPGIILPLLQKLPDELQEFSRSAHFYRSKSGWMTRELFELYCVNLAHELTHFRLSLPAEKRGRRFLLLVDGHSSRKSPKALAYLQQHGIDMLTFPGHSTHVVQPFDVGLAAIMKTFMARSIQNWNRELDGGTVVAPSAAATKRFVLVSTFLQALDECATKNHIRAAFRRSGIVPVDSEVPLSSPLMLPDSRFDHMDDWISASYFGLGSPVLCDFLRQAGITAVTTEAILCEKTDRALTPIFPRIDQVSLSYFPI